MSGPSFLETTEEKKMKFGMLEQLLAYFDELFGSLECTFQKDNASILTDRTLKNYIVRSSDMDLRS